MNESQLTLEAFLKGFEQEIKHHLFYLATMYGTDAVARLTDKPDYSMFAPEAFEIDLGESYLGTHAKWLFSYAIEGKLYRGFHAPDLNDALRVIDLLCITNLECNDELAPEVECVWRKANARARFDSQRKQIGQVSENIDSWWVVGEMTIDDVAWLCDMSPASVRNSTTAKAKDPLKTFRENGKVYVDPVSLSDWLSRRRGYQETRVIELKETENEGFSDLGELQQFLASRLRNLKVEFDAVAKAADLETTVLLHFTLGGDLPEGCWEIDTIIGLAKALDLADSSFISRATAVVLEHKLKVAGLTPKAEVVPFKPRNGTDRSSK